MMSRRHEAWLRVRWRFPLKFIGVSAYMTVFMWGYFTLLRHPLYPATVVPLQGLDRWIPPTAWGIGPYASLWVYVSFVPLLLRDYATAWRYVSAVTLVSTIGFGVFLFWPTVTPAFHVDWASHPTVAWLKSADASGNACPSLHVAFSVLTALFLAQTLRELDAAIWLRVANVAWCALIVWSTLALRQHVALDVETGALLGGAIAWVHLRYWRCNTGRSRNRRPLVGDACE